jgi:uncharacterized protein (TIGR02001 family)
MLAMKNTMTAAGISAAILAGGLTTSSGALADFTANIGATSNYVWRGATQTGNAPAIQGGMDYESGIGIYAGTWVSNVNFGDEPSLEDGAVSIRSGSEYEADFYAGWGMEFGDNLGLDLGYTYYYYGQNESGADFGEIYGKFAFWWFEVGAYYTANDQSDSVGSDLNPFVTGDFFYYGKFSIDFAESWNVGFTLGQYEFTNDGATFADGEVADYNYAYGQLDLTKSADEYGDITLSVTNADNANADGNDSAKVFITWTKGF